MFFFIVDHLKFPPKSEQDHNFKKKQKGLSYLDMGTHIIIIKNGFGLGWVQQVQSLST
jgi:hypothetical protein